MQAPRVVDSCVNLSASPVSTLSFFFFPPDGDRSEGGINSES